MIPWDFFCYRFLPPDSCFDKDHRPKTFEALKALAAQLPVDILGDLPNLALFAPNANTGGEAITFRGQGDGLLALIYLAPLLEDHSQEYINHTVAHEFAHLVLRHDDQSPDTCEDEANVLAAKWGFPPTPF